jgi:hypothetical protein
VTKPELFQDGPAEEITGQVIGVTLDGAMSVHNVSV